MIWGFRSCHSDVDNPTVRKFHDSDRRLRVRLGGRNSTRLENLESKCRSRCRVSSSIYNNQQSLLLSAFTLPPLPLSSKLPAVGRVRNCDQSNNVCQRIGSIIVAIDDDDPEAEGNAVAASAGLKSGSIDLTRVVNAVLEDDSLQSFMSSCRLVQRRTSHCSSELCNY